MSEELAGKIALISGGARGMGETHARTFVDRGAKVVLGDILDDAGTALAQELGDNAVYIHLDVTSSADWDAAVALAVSTFGGLNVLVNNAGIAGGGPIGEYTEKAWNTIIGINLTGQFLGITAAKDALVASAPSSIINISSTNGFQGSAALHGYTAAKFGVRGLTKSVAMELGSQGIRVNSVHPGPVRTPMTDTLDTSNLPSALHRIGEPEEISKLVAFLASEDSSYSTGSEFIADGGQLAGIPEIPAR
jgi:3alpha(or 20beta)-hydroxysteroid dehydrogenase